MTTTPANIAQLNMEIDIKGSVEQVWMALTDNIGLWWPADFYAGGEEGARDYTLEAWPGGRMFESWQPAGGVLWGNVICIEPNKRLQVLGSSFANWGGPSQWYGTWELSKGGQGTLLKFSESTIGQVSDSGLAEKDKGWQFLWNNLKAHVEGTAPPGW